MLLPLGPFTGEAPRYEAEYLPQNAASMAMDCKIQSGALSQYRGSQAVSATAVPNAASLHGWYSSFAADRTPDAIRFVTWAQDIDVAPAPIRSNSVADQQVFATGFGSATGPRVLRYGDVITGAEPYTGTGKRLGVLRENTPPTVENTDASKGANPTERSYLYTRVREFSDGTQWESQPSAPTPQNRVVMAAEGDEVTVTIPAEARADKGDGATHINVYRSAVGATTALFRFVRKIAIGLTSTVDDIRASGLGLPLGSQDNRPAPGEMVGIIAAHNGIYAGFSGFTLYLSQAGAPEAWPEDYDRFIDSRIIALASVGESIVVLTDGYPWIFAGSTPGAMISRRLDSPAPCVSKNSVVVLGNQVVYASNGGLVTISVGGKVDEPSRAVVSWEAWQAQVDKPETVRGAEYRGRYIGAHQDGTFLFDPRQGEPQPSWTRLSFTSSKLWRDISSGCVFGLQAVQGQTNPAIACFDDPSEDEMLLTWRSKTFVFQRPTSFSAAKVIAEYGGEDVRAKTIAMLMAANQQRIVQYLAPGALGGGDGLLAYALRFRMLDTNLEAKVLLRAWNGVPGETGVRLLWEVGFGATGLARLPMVGRSSRMVFEIVSSGTVRKVYIAESPREIPE